MKRIFALLLLLSLLLVFATAYGQYEVGELVADFQLPDAYGNPVNLYDYQDRIIILPFWESG